MGSSVNNIKFMTSRHNATAIYDQIGVQSSFTNTHAGVFDGTGDFAKLPKSATLQRTSAELDATGFTFSCWAKKAEESSGSMGLFCTDGAGQGAYYGIGIQCGNDNKLRINLYDGDGGSGSQSRRTAVFNTTLITPETGWFHLVCVMPDQDKANWKMYINGADQTSITTSGTGSTVGYLLTGYAGLGINRNTPWNGMIDEAAVWNVGLTPAQVTAIWNCNANQATPIDLQSDSGDYNVSNNLIAYWRMEETWTDLENGINGTAQGDAQFGDTFNYVAC